MIVKYKLVFWGYSTELDLKQKGVMVKKKKKSNGTIIFSYTLYGDPPSKKNSKQLIYNKRTHKPVIVGSKKFQRWYKQVIKQVKNDRVPKLHINDMVNAKMLIYRKDRRGGPGDVNNFVQAPLDLLRDIGVIDDDNRDIVYSTDGSRLFYDKENPRIEIELAITEEGL